MIRLLLGFICLILPNIASSITFNSNLTNFNDYQNVKVTVIDGVNGGCFTNLKEVREYSEEKIKSSGMSLNFENPYFNFVIYAVGHRINSGCSGFVTVGLYYNDTMVNGTRVLVTIKEVGKTLTQPSLNYEILDTVGMFFGRQ